MFTDIEGSTRRWEADPEGMRTALAAHDEVLRSAVEVHGGWLFKHTGDGVCAAFGSPRGAIDAATDAQRGLVLPVRMGMATGEAELRGDDYFGPALNRAARVMAAGHGGQILVAASTAGLVSGHGLVDLGERRLRDLSGAEHLFQVAGEGLRVEFPPLRTLDTTPGNLAVQLTSFVGRDLEVKELSELVRANRLVTLTGVGGVGKTRLAVQVAAELTGEFPDGVWLVELAPVGDPDAVPDAVATVLGVTAQAGMSVTASVTQALSGRRLLVVLDNCEHLLDAAADLVEAILGRTSTVSVLATSREGLRVSAEQVWTVPSLGVGDGVDSPAVTLFVRRAQAANSSFALYDDADVVAVREICERLDGIALSIELAAARMVSMSPQDVRDRLGERFRLLAGGRRGLERHQTLRHAVAWSYDLLNDEERAVLCRCSVFASGFDLAAAAHLNEGFDEYAVLDVLDSLVRKSLVTVNQAGGHARYGMLETIRQYAEDQLAATGGIEQVRDRHARYFAEQAVAHWVLWDGPHQRDSLDWFDEKFANLRAGFRWATDRGDLACAAAIAAHSAMLGGASLGRYKPVEWVEEILGAANRADLAQLPRLYVAASFCGYNGRPDQAASYAQTAAALEADGRYDPFEAGWSGILEANAHGYAGRIDRFLEIHTGMAAMGGFAHVAGLCGLSSMSPNAGHSEQGRAIAEVAVTTAAAYGNPALIAWAAWGFGRAFEHADPDRALSALREGLLYAQQHRADYFEALIARDVARVAAMHGEIDQGLGAFDASIDSFHRAGNVRFLAFTLADLAVIFDRIELHDNAATLYGASKRHGSGYRSHRLQSALEHLNAVLGNSVYAQRVAIGAAMELSDAVAYAHHHIQTARTKFTGPS